MPDLTTRDVAEEMRLSPDTIATWAADGRFPGAYRTGTKRGQWRIPRASLDAFRTPPATVLAPRNARSTGQQRKGRAA